MWQFMAKFAVIINVDGTPCLAVGCHECVNIRTIDIYEEDQKSLIVVSARSGPDGGLLSAWHDVQ